MSYNFNSDIDRNGKKKRPKCAKCRNHGLFVLRLGHKGCCQYDECECELCKQTKTRNDAMAKTMANERRRKKESGRTSVSSTTSPVSEYPYSAERTRTSFNIQLDGYNPASGGNLGSYNVGRVANTMSYTSSSSAKNACNPFGSPMETKVFGTNSYHNFYHSHRATPQGFPTPPYKTEPDQSFIRAAFLNPLNPLNGFGAGTQPHLTMIGSTNK